MKLNRHFRLLMRSILVNTVVTGRLYAGSRESVLLTFDDGPHEKITPVVLDKLKSHGARCMFFVVGRFARDCPGIVRRVLKDGHLLGNHSFTHDNGRMLDFKGCLRDMRSCQRFLRDSYGINPRFFRPPGGRVTPQMLVAAWSLNLRIMLWSNMGGEWANRSGDDAETIARTLTDRIAARDIVMLHDNNRKVPDILDIILPAIRDKGLDLSIGLERVSKTQALRDDSERNLKLSRSSSPDVQ